MFTLGELSSSDHDERRDTEHVLHRFSRGSDGGNPEAGVIVTATGHLYGTTFWGGNFGYGVVFELTHTSNAIAGRNRCCMTSTTWTERILLPA